MEGRILVSACLLGQPVRYDGRGKPLFHPHLERWKEEGRVVGFCPEMAAGMPAPRAPAEIAGGATGADVLDGKGRVIDSNGLDVTAEFLSAAEKALAMARHHRCRHALLIDGSPSCGSIAIYDGSFAGRKHAGSGVTAALLARSGIAVFAPSAIEALAEALSSDGA